MMWRPAQWDTRRSYGAAVIIALGIDIEHLLLEDLRSQVGQAQQELGLGGTGAADGHGMSIQQLRRISHVAHDTPVRQLAAKRHASTGFPYTRSNKNSLHFYIFAIHAESSSKTLAT